MKVDSAELSLLLEQNNLKVTDHRLCLLNIFISQKLPRSVLELQMLIPKKVVINQATLYRTVESFVGCGLIQVINSRAGELKYEYNRGLPTIIINCAYCRTSEKITSTISDDIIKKISKKAKMFKGYDHYSLILSSECNKCKNK